MDKTSPKFSCPLRYDRGSLDFKQREWNDAVRYPMESQGRVMCMPQLGIERSDTAFSWRGYQFYIRFIIDEWEGIVVARAEDDSINILNAPIVIISIGKMNRSILINRTRSRHQHYIPKWLHFMTRRITQIDSTRDTSNLARYIRTRGTCTHAKHCTSRKIGRVIVFDCVDNFSSKIG